MGGICIFSVRLSSSLSGESLSLELNGMSADSWCWVFCPLVFVSLSPRELSPSVYVRARTLVLSGSLFVLLLVIARSLLVSAWPLCCGNFDGDSVCLFFIYYYYYYLRPDSVPASLFASGTF